MREMATLSLLFMPPLYIPDGLSPTPPLKRSTLFRDSSTAYKIKAKIQNHLLTIQTQVL